MDVTALLDVLRHIVGRIIKVTPTDYLDHLFDVLRGLQWLGASNFHFRSSNHSTEWMHQAAWAGRTKMKRLGPCKAKKKKRGWASFGGKLWCPGHLQINEIMRWWWWNYNTCNRSRDWCNFFLKLILNKAKTNKKNEMKNTSPKIDPNCTIQIDEWLVGQVAVWVNCACNCIYWSIWAWSYLIVDIRWCLHVAVWCVGYLN